MNNTAPKSIDEVLSELDIIIEECLSNNSPLGVFAYVYRRTTAEVRAALQNKEFEDNERMEAFDVRFANYYIQAYKDFKAGKAISKSWKVSFESANKRLSIVQHLMMGMNAHINLDLALTACEMMKDKDLFLLENDFKKVNEILFGLTDEMQTRLLRVSKLMWLFDRLGKNKDEAIINFGMEKARGLSWKNAVSLWATKDFGLDQQIDLVDSAVHRIGMRIQSPKTRIARWLMKLLSYFETSDMTKAIALLRN